MWTRPGTRSSARSPRARSVAYPPIAGRATSSSACFASRTSCYRYVQDGPPGTTESLLRPFVKVPDSLPGDQVIALLREKRAHQAAVIDQAGLVVGFITIQDVLSEFLGSGGRAS